MTNLKFGKKIIAILLLFITLIAIGTVIFLQLSGQRSVANIVPAVPSYIGNSKIFLMSANSSYGNYGGSPCFIVNITLRNDYTPQQPVPDKAYSNNTGLAWICLTAKLYDGNNSTISAHDISGPNLLPFNLPQYSIESRGTQSFSIYMSMTSRNIDHYSLDMIYLGALAAP